MKYILIIILSGIYGVQPTTVEFDTLKACQYALQRVTESYGEGYSICVPKGDEQ